MKNALPFILALTLLVLLNTRRPAPLLAHSSPAVQANANSAKSPPMAHNNTKSTSRRTGTLKSTCMLPVICIAIPMFCLLTLTAYILRTKN